MDTISKIMTRNIVSVKEDTPLLNIATLLVKNGFNGVPVIDKENRLIGIITEYDFILKNENIHLPTLIKLFKDIDLYKKDAGTIEQDIKSLINLKAKDIMNKEPFKVVDTTTIIDVVKSFADHHKVNPIPIVDKDNNLVGLVSRHDILRFIAGGTKDLELDSSKEISEENISQLMNNLDKEFILVSKDRTRLWLVASLLFALAGFSIAWFLILRVNF